MDSGKLLFLQLIEPVKGLHCNTSEANLLRRIGKIAEADKIRCGCYCTNNCIVQRALVWRAEYPGSRMHGDNGPAETPTRRQRAHPTMEK